MTCHFKNLDGLVWHSVFQITTGRKRRSVNQEEKAEHVDDHTADLVVGSFVVVNLFLTGTRHQWLERSQPFIKLSPSTTAREVTTRNYNPHSYRARGNQPVPWLQEWPKLGHSSVPLVEPSLNSVDLVGLRWDMPRCFPFMPPNLLCSIGRQGWKSGGLATGCPCRTRVATGPANWVQQSWRTRLKWWSRGSRPRIVKKQGSCTTARSKKIPLIMICHFVLCVSENRDGLELPDFWFLVVFSFLTCSVGWTFHYWWIHQFLSVLACKYYLDCIYMKSSFSFSAPIVSHLVICPHRNF